MDDDDLESWKSAAKSVKPLKSQKLRAPGQKISEIIIEHISHPKDAPKHRDGELSEGEMVGVDRSTAKKLKAGKIPLEGTLDLHGKTKDEAFGLLKNFLHESYARRKKCVIIITGKGKMGEGILKENVQKWLNLEGLREYVLMFSYAKIQDGGHGALYVLLARKSNS